MRKLFFCVLGTLLLMPMIIFGQTYDGLWKKVRQAEEKDLPQTQLQTLQKIVDKATKERAYGQLLKAGLTKARVQTLLSPDSLQPAMARLKQQAEVAAGDVPLQAVYYAVLGRIYRDNRQLDDEWERLANDYFKKAMEHPAQLAAVKTADYEPFVVKGKDSRLYDDDLLSLIGRETRQYRQMYDYYLTTNNRRAQLMSAVSLIEQEEPDEREAMATSPYLRRIDSLIARYGDLTECGDLAITRYEFMADMTDATTEQKVAYIDEALDRWGSWPHMNWLRNYRNDLTALCYHAELPQMMIPQREQNIFLRDLRGIGRLQLRFYRVKADGDIDLNPRDDRDYKKLRPLLTPLPELSLQRTYEGKKDYELFNDTLTLAALPVGVYMMEAESAPQTEVSRTLFFVSDVRVLSQALPGNRIRFVAVSATTGQPLPGAQLRLMRGYGYAEKKTTTTITTGKNGEYVYQVEGNSPNLVFATHGDDRACQPMDFYNHFGYYDLSRTLERTNVYTDRAIYRPGQTVQVAAIIYKVENGFEHQVVAAKKVTVRLRDVNYKVVAEQELITDDFGTVSARFTLPATGLSGRYSVHVGNATQFFRVEEYKRPTFQVEFPVVEEDYKAGDTLTVKATARTYAGVPVQGARVKYRVERRLAFWWLSYYRYWQGGYFGSGQQSELMLSGEATTADDGTFEVQMPMVIPFLGDTPQFYNFVVTADVTDQGGETHQGQLSLPLGNRRNALTTDLPDKMLAEQPATVKLHVLNAAGNDVEAQVKYRIESLPQSKGDGKWIAVQSNTAISLPRLKSGKYRLTAEYDGERLERDFVVFSLDDKRSAAQTDDWFYVSDKQFPNDGRPITVQVGSSANDVHIVYTFVAGNTIVEQGAADRSDELINRKLTYKPEYGNGLTLSFAWMKEGKSYTHEVQLQRPLPDKQLTLKWETFRDRLTPGQQEEWTLSVKSKEQSVNASFMAVLFDKSLDQIVKHQWTLDPVTLLPMASLHWTTGGYDQTGCRGSYHAKHLDSGMLQFSHFDTECFPQYWMGRHRMMKFKGMRMEEVAVGAQRAVVLSANETADVAMPMMASAKMSRSGAVMNDAIGAFDMAGHDEAAEEESMAAEPEVQVRENLQETAFCYPQLETDEEGRVRLKFTLPESLTTWRFMGIAHTKDMMHGYIDAEAVAQKDVMIQPNVPRFLRMGDEGTISARLFNTTDGCLSGSVRLQLLDPESEQPIIDEQMPCTLAANGTNAVSFNIDSSKLEGHSLLVCKMTVSGETFSDGEQLYLPILSDRERVTITVPFTQNGQGTKTIDLTTLFPASLRSAVLDQRSLATEGTQEGRLQGKNDQRPTLGTQPSTLTVEYTNNPAWLMIQALPTIGNPCDKNAISQAASLYANTLGEYILAQNTQAKHVFEAWKRENAQTLSLSSQLEKNEELKDLLLSETPWVMDADRETEQKRQLADFFDGNLMQQRLASAATQLQKLQNADGSWSWWEGMRGSFFMTVEISEMIVRLNQMTGRSHSQLSTLNTQLDKAFQFMNNEIVDMVAEMKKQEKKGIRQTFPTFKALQYLYLCTLDGRSQPANVQQAQDYLKNLLKKDVKNQTIYEKAMSAIVLHSSLYIKSLKEYTVYTEEMGRYYDTPRASYSWRDYRIPTQVAAIEALQRLSPDDTQTIDEMRRWLLQQKRTQAWDTPLNSVDAIYAFLNGNSAALAAQPKTVMKIDGKQIDTSEATAGIGYVKTAQTYKGERTLTAEKTSAGTSWGAVYAQYFQKTGDISDQKSGISVKREILSGETLKVGQRVKVRLTIEADRDYDFVEVADRRAACLEPVQQLSGYRSGAYCSPKDNATYYYFDMLSKGKHVIETEYYIDRRGHYETGTCTVQCAYAPEFRGTTRSIRLKIED